MGRTGHWLGAVGAYLASPPADPAPVDQQRRELARLEALGYRSIWTNEQISGKDVPAHLAILLAASDRLVVGSAVANAWARHPATLHGRAALLEPKTTALAAERADGAIPFGMPVAHTAASRRILGPDKLLVVGVQVVHDTDRERARAAARVLKKAMHQANPTSSYFTELRRFGFCADDIDTVADAVVDATVAHGDADAVAARVGEHLAAGADHVVLFPSAQTLTAAGDVLDRLAGAVRRR